MEGVRNSEETPCPQYLIILRNFQYWRKFFIVCLVSSFSDSVAL